MLAKRKDCLGQRVNLYALYDEKKGTLWPASEKNDIPLFCTSSAMHELYVDSCFL